MSNYSTQENSPVRPNRSLVLTIEGNIGAGKSTFLKTLNDNLKGDFDFVPENVSSWQNVANSGINVFDMMYKDPKRWGFIF
jgi:deoxyadenosine/deoxycytidine kinase